MLRSVWDPFAQQLDSVASVAVREVIDKLDARLGPHLFPLQVTPRQHMPRCSSCESHPWHVAAVSKDWVPLCHYCLGDSCNASNSGHQRWPKTFECGMLACMLQNGQSEAEARRCPLCQSRLTLKLARNGGFVGCSAWPECSYLRPLTEAHADTSTSGNDLSG